ncbi:hypothetical protein MASR2M117_13010 [Paludibacter sp.]
MKHLTFLKTWLLAMALMVVGSGSVWGAKISDFAQIVSGKSYIIGATVSGTDYYFTVSDVISAAVQGGVSSTNAAGATVFRFTGSGTSWTIQFANNNYLSLKNTADNGKVVVQAASSTWTLSNVSSKIRMMVGATYALQFNTSAKDRFGSYAKTQTDLWVEEVVSCTSATASFTSATVNKLTTDGAFTNSFTTNNTSAKSFSSSAPGVATVNATTGEVIIVGAGTTTISVTQIADGTYCEVSASYTLNVTAPTFDVTPISNNVSYGTVSLSDYVVITATPASGYRVSVATPYTVTSGAATVSQNGNVFTVTPTSVCTVQINFEEIPKYTVSFNAGSGSYSGGNLTETSGGAGVTLPSATGCGTWTFAGWATSAVSETTSTPELLLASATYYPAANTTLYAVYSETEGTPISWDRVTALNDIVTGTYVIVNGEFFLPNTNTTASKPPIKVTLASKSVSVSGNTLSGTIDSDMQWTFTGTNAAMAITSAANASDILYNINDNNGVRVNTTTDNWAFEVYSTGFAMKDATNSRFCAVYTGGSDWRSYTTKNATNYNTNSGILDIYKKSGGSETTYNSTPSCPVPTITVTEASWSFNCQANQTSEKTFTVTASNLSADMSISITGANYDKFSYTKLGGFDDRTGGDVKVTYTPTVEGTHTAKLVLSSTGADDEEVVLNGTAGPITSLENATSNFALRISNDKVMFNATAGEVIEIYNVAGQKIINQITTDGLNTITVTHKGVMVVKVGDKIAKIVK